MESYKSRKFILVLIVLALLTVFFFFTLFFLKSDVVLVSIIGGISTISGLYFGYNVHQKKITGSEE